MSRTYAALSAATIWNDRCRRRLLAAVGLAVAAALPAVAGAGSSAVVLMYHHVDDESPASTSVRPETFERHLAYLDSNDFHVWDLPRLIDAVRSGRAIPERTVALTFDDAYDSVYETAWPLLAERDWPLTVFVAPDEIDDGGSAYADWDQLREMAENGVTIANHSLTHSHMARPRRQETEGEWLERVRHEVEAAQTRLEDELDEVPRLFAWPYGEFSPPAQSLLEEMDFVGFGQHSGAIGPGSDFSALPRFPMAVGFDGLESFALKVRTRPLPVTATEPASGVMDPDRRRPALTVELGDGRFDAARLACYSRGESLTIEWLDRERTAFHVEGGEVAGAGRTRFNCTAPATDGDRWYWYSFQWMMPNNDGSWYED